ncbi:unnamed protein product [Effrenium voratum]|nr:unnamed protein product [Effrenium voratum]
MFKDETRSLRQAGLAEAGSVFVGHGAPCAPEEVLLKVVLYCYDKGKPLQVRDAFTFPARGDSSVRSLREALLQPLATWAKSQADLEVEIPSTWKRLRLRDFQAGKGHAILRDLRTLRSALLGLSDGRQVAVQVMDQDEELGLDDMVILLRPWRVQEARLYAPSELVVTKNQSLAEFQDKLTERFKGLLKGGEEDKENALPTEDSLEIVAAHATGPPLTVKRCETLKWADSRLSPGAERVEKPLADFKEVRDGVTLVVRSRAAEAPAAQAVPKKGTGKGPATAATAAAAAAEKKKSKPWASAQASGRERGLVIQVSHPEACAEDQQLGLCRQCESRLPGLRLTKSDFGAELQGPVLNQMLMECLAVDVALIAEDSSVRKCTTVRSGLVKAEGPYDLVAVQLLEEECPAAAKDEAGLRAWQPPTVASLEARAHLAGSFGQPSRAAALAHWLQALLQLFEEHLAGAFLCSALAAQHLQSTAEWALSLDQPRRARVLIQLGHAFKFQALKDFASLYHEMKETYGTEGMAQAPVPKRFLPRLHVQYQIMLGQLHEALRVQPAQLWSRSTSFPRVEIHSICSYKPDPTSKTSLESPLLGLSVPNHRAYAARHGYGYVVHTESALPDREAHYSKMYVVYQRLGGQTPHWAYQATSVDPQPPEWLFFIDCDAFFTDFSRPIAELISTYAEEATQFLVAEDPGGINTGVFLIRNSAWSMGFLERVAGSRFTVAWDQSMFFWHMVRGALDMDLSFPEADFTYPREVRLVHQAHFNAFVPPASVDWMAHEWRAGDFVRHFAGCPWQEQPCLDMMLETAELAQLNAAQQVWLDERGNRVSSCQLTAINLIAYGFASKAWTLAKASAENCFSVHTHTSSSWINFACTGDAQMPVLSRLCAHVQGWPVGGSFSSRSQLVRAHAWCKVQKSFQQLGVGNFCTYLLAKLGRPARQQAAMQHNPVLAGRAMPSAGRAPLDPWTPPTSPGSEASPKRKSGQAKHAATLRASAGRPRVQSRQRRTSST